MSASATLQYLDDGRTGFHRDGYHADRHAVYASLAHGLPDDDARSSSVSASAGAAFGPDGKQRRHGQRRRDGSSLPRRRRPRARTRRAGGSAGRDGRVQPQRDTHPCHLWNRGGEHQPTACLSTTGRNSDTSRSRFRDPQAGRRGLLRARREAAADDRQRRVAPAHVDVGSPCTTGAGLQECERTESPRAGGIQSRCRSGSRSPTTTAAPQSGTSIARAHRR